MRGPLHGIPIALKDNIHTTNMPTSGGALAFDGFIPPYEATLTKNLIEAGAIIIAKAAMSELAGYTAGAPTPAPGDYNAVGGQGFNPVRSAPRSAAGDRRRPARAEHRRLELGHRHRGESVGRQHRHRNVGLDSRAVELSDARRGQADGRTREPLGRDPDHRRSGHGRSDGAHRHRRRDPARRARRQPRPIPNDAATSRCTPPPGNDYTPFLKPDALRGARIGIPRAFYYDKVTPPGGKEPRGGLNPAQAKAMAEAIDVLKQQGAVIVDPADIPSVLDTGSGEDDPRLELLRRRRRRARQGHAAAPSSSSTG